MVLRGVIGVVLAAFLVYGFARAYPLLKGPEIQLESPADGTSSPSGFITVSGVAKHTETLLLNGGPLLIDEKGRFSRELLLTPGTSILTLTAQDRFGRRVSEMRTVYVPEGVETATSSVP